MASRCRSCVLDPGRFVLISRLSDSFQSDIHHKSGSFQSTDDSIRKAVEVALGEANYPLIDTAAVYENEEVPISLCLFEPKVDVVTGQ